MSDVLLDTTVLIDVARRFAPTVAWVSRQRSAALYLSTITVGELVRGAYRAAAGSGERLAAELHQVHRDLLPRFGGRILAFDLASAEVWGRLLAEGEVRGSRPPVDDAKIAAIALRHGLVVATSNTRHLAPLCPTLDPRTA
ncbi:MAG TPA: PIN domain-containing protein [Geminicoccaceae bacterium]|nr:PIN domain-containing protein [Geminicoccaceae bacterium]